jgi:hypothetical protein
MANKITNSNKKLNPKDFDGYGEETIFEWFDEVHDLETKIERLINERKRRQNDPETEDNINYDEEPFGSDANIQLEIEKLRAEKALLVEPRITLFKIRKDFIPPKGDKRKIIIKGDPGCIFSLTIKDSSGCSILKEEIENHKINDWGEYEFTQDFPSILTNEGASKSSEYYTIVMLPAAGVEFAASNSTETLSQYADPIITVTNTTSQTFDSGKTLIVGGSDDITTGSALSHTENIPGYSDSTYTLTITESAPADGNFYVKNSSFNDNITSNTTIKKKLSRGDETGPTTQLALKPLTTRIDTTIEGGDSVPTGDVVMGMRVYAKVEKTKKVKASLDKDDNVLNYGRCNTPTDKIELSDTNDLIEGMIVSGIGITETSIKSIDCNNKTITLSKKYIIKKDTELTFTREWRTSVAEVIECSSEGITSIKITPPVDIPDGTEILFDDDANLVRGRIFYSGSGSNTIILTIYLRTIRYGYKNVTYTLDLDNIITRKPNAYDQEISIKKNSSGYNVYILNRDGDADRTSKIGTVVRAPSHGKVGAWHVGRKSFTYTPHAGFCGEDSFTFTTAISAEDVVESSEEKTVRITVK